MEWFRMSINEKHQLTVCKFWICALRNTIQNTQEGLSKAQKVTEAVEAKVDEVTSQFHHLSMGKQPYPANTLSRMLI